ncbi:MAG: iron-containing alcohol dehydrogenase [Thermoguttaceae bacterium]|nr:iron-containing alcohol dehydrogenase [Thermoguttaceae bacterium]MDW8079791.1 iron-containing alcohol dehydrogenase [Thermoguttaceae bacterium]
MRYEFVAPRQIVFGRERLRELPDLVKTVAQRVWLVPGSRRLVARGVVAQIVAALRDAGVYVFELPVIDHEPLVGDVDRWAEGMLRQGVIAGDAILAVGGGSAIDLAKALAGVIGEALGSRSDRPPRIVEFLEGVGTGRKIQHPPLPVIAVPTTAGAGAEATRNAVISSHDPPFKKSFRDSRLMPQIVVVDPVLTVDLPADITAATGMDAITQLVESYISKRWQPIPRALALQGLKLAVKALPRAVRDGSDLEAREAMAHAALLSGMALANSGLGMAHGIAAALGVHCQIPHGLACAMLLPTAIRVNAEVCPNELAELARYVYGEEAPQDARAASLFLADKMDQLCQMVGIPRKLSQVGVTPEKIPAIVRDSRGTSMQGNPRELSDQELTRILEELQ